MHVLSIPGGTASTSHFCPLPRALPVTRVGSGEEGKLLNVSSLVIVHSVSSYLLSISYLEGPGTGGVQGKAKPGIWLQGAYDPMKGQSTEHTGGVQVFRRD